MLLRPDEPGQASGDVQFSRFVTGSTLRHVIVMTGASAVGLTALFSVDLLNVFYINLLGRDELTAAVGFASAILMFQISLGIGLGIGTSVFVSRFEGARRLGEAKSHAIAGIALSVLLSLLIVLVVMPFLPLFVADIGARGATADYTLAYLRLTFPAMPFLIVTITSSGILRALGDAKGAMWVTLSGGLVNAAIDPILILYLELGLDGAAYAAVISRLVSFLVGIALIIIRHSYWCRVSGREFLRLARAILRLSLPIMLTNIATAVGVYILTEFVAQHGDAANAANTVINRFVPFLFGFLFSLSGAVGPVLGQNIGAKAYDRAERAFAQAIGIVFVYTLIVCLAMVVFSRPLATTFASNREVVDLIVFFLTYAGWSYAFFGALIVSNAVFNTIDEPYFATAFNWGRATLGVYPFCWLGAHYFGIKGVILFFGFGFVPFGIAAAFLAYLRLRKVAREGFTMASPDPSA